MDLPIYLVSKGRHPAGLFLKFKKLNKVVKDVITNIESTDSW